MKKYFVGLLWILIAGCKEKYNPAFTAPSTGYLVVEGLINNGSDSTIIELSRTNKMGSVQKQYEKDAMVQVEGNDNSIFKLAEIVNGGGATGRYSAQLNLNNLNQYRLRIKTLTGKEYLSDFVEVKITPPIDSISWQRENGNGLQLYVNTHDPQNKTYYYQWDYQETWEFHSAYRAVLKFNTIPSPRGPIPYLAFIDSTTFGPDTTIFKCWKSSVSNQLLLGSSAKLSEDRIYKPFLFIPRGDRKMSVLYSIYLKQYALTKTGYGFLSKMKKNTEENGTVFDPQPSELRGNIHCISDAYEPVIGYISVSSIAVKRIFISNGQLTNWNYTSDCVEASVKNNRDSIAEAFGSGSIPTGILDMTMAGNTINHFGMSAPECIDCTISGTNIKPLFWP